MLEQDPALLGAGASVAPTVETAPWVGRRRSWPCSPLRSVTDPPARPAKAGPTPSRLRCWPTYRRPTVPSRRRRVAARSSRSPGPGTPPRPRRQSNAQPVAAAPEDRAALRTAAAEQATRLADLAHPGQIVLSRPTRDSSEARLHEVDVRELGQHRLTDLGPASPSSSSLRRASRSTFRRHAGSTRCRRTCRSSRRRSSAGKRSRSDRRPRPRSRRSPGDAHRARRHGQDAAGAPCSGGAAAGRPGWDVVRAARCPARPGSGAVDRRLHPGVAADGPSALGAVARELEGRRTLLILDNFEHLLAASAFVTQLLEAAPGVTVLVTSRVPLKLEGSASSRCRRCPSRRPTPPWPPMRTSPRSLAVGSVALFAARAAAVRPEFALTTEGASAVVRLCRALDGLPLAIELAASRLGLMSPAAILERLDRPLRLVGTRGLPGGERHLAIDAAIDWSHDLLGPAARQLFAELAVFAGGWTLDAAEAVWRGPRRRRRTRRARRPQPGADRRGRGGSALRDARDNPGIRGRQARRFGRPRGSRGAPREVLRLARGIGGAGAPWQPRAMAGSARDGPRQLPCGTGPPSRDRRWPRHRGTTRRRALAVLAPRRPPVGGADPSGARRCSPPRAGRDQGQGPHRCRRHGREHAGPRHRRRSGRRRSSWRGGSATLRARPTRSSCWRTRP